VKTFMALALALALLAFAGPAFAEPVRILVSVSNRLGLPAEQPLKFAHNDAARVREVMVSLGGVKPEHAWLVAEPNRAQLYAAVDRARAEAQKHRADEVTFLFYFSGHGDREALHVGADRVLLTDLSNKLGQVPAGLRIAVTDACRATREKGFTADEPFAISAAMVASASGQVWLHASGDGEAAQESDQLRGAIFTHAWLNGLRGAADANGDARVTLEESFAFAHSQTMIRSAKSSGVLQKPQAVVSLRESAPVVLTQTASKMATLSLPPARDAHFLVYSAGAKSVLSELWGSPDRRLELRVPPGRYVVHRRLAGRGGAAQIALGEGDLRKLDERDFTAASLELLASKGGDVAEARPVAAGARAEAPPHEVSVGYDTGANARTGMVHGPRAGYARAWGNVAVTIGGGAELTGRALPESEERLTSGYGRAGLELRVPAGGLLLRGGAAGRLGWVSQTIEPRDPTSAVRADRPAGTQGAFVAGPEVVLGVRATLSRAWFLDAALTGSVLFLREDEAVRGVPGATGSLSLGARFGD
jgi:hypothetical protein